VGLVAIAVGLVAATLIVLGTTSETATCPAFPACLASPATWVGAVHEIAAGLLLVLIVAMIALAAGLRREHGHPLGASIGALALLVGMASVGAGLASGAIPLGLASIQFGFLAALIALIAWAARDARRISGAPRTVTERPSP
jgi:heme A synthase